MARVPFSEPREARGERLVRDFPKDIYELRSQELELPDFADVMGS
jgi:hypothetical protein